MGTGVHTVQRGHVTIPGAIRFHTSLVDPSFEYVHPHSCAMLSTSTPAAAAHSPPGARRSPRAAA
jgi:hypothetical protein